MQKTVTCFTVSVMSLCIFIFSATSQLGAAPPPDTIVLVHGFAGWGRDEMDTAMGNLPYWGGIVTDIEAVLEDAGYLVLTASVGPFSSNWDRACELYAQIVNAPTVDYGKVHAQTFEHARFVPNKNYRESNTIDPGSGTRIHLIAHSMGTSTSRLLIQLLEEGSAHEMAEKAGGGYDDISPLFDTAQDTRGLVFSLTSLSGAVNGTTLANIADDLIPMAQEIIVVIGAMAGGFADDDPLYDFDLAHFGLERSSGENWHDYARRVGQSAIWQSPDTCLKDLMPQGVCEANEWIKPVQPNVYYLSYSTGQTRNSCISLHNYHIPTIHMVPYLSPMGYLIGRYSQELECDISITDAWWPNDGVVNTISQKYPFLNYTDQALNGTWEQGVPENPVRGKWYHIETLDADHMDIIGLGFDVTSPFGQKHTLDAFYLGIAQMLSGLE